MYKATIILTLTTAMILAVLTGSSVVKKQKEYQYFEDPQVCSGCHWDRFERWNVSQHSRAFTGDFFQRQFYDLVLPSMKLDDRLAGTNEDCLGCHGPVSFLAGDMFPEPAGNTDNMWNRDQEIKTLADRGIFCDFCHTLDGFEHIQPFNHDYISAATPEVDPKRADLQYPWSPHHETRTSMLYENTEMCATCHNEQNPYGVWVKATQKEYLESEYPGRGIVCQTCHMQPMGGKPAKMGQIRVQNTDHWFGGGFSEFVEGAARVEVLPEKTSAAPGEQIRFRVRVQALATGHKFPTGSVEERDVWLHVTANDRNGKEIAHITIPRNPDDPNDAYFITTNRRVAYPSHSTLSDPIPRDALPEGDRLYHSAFIDSEGEFTYAQWLAVKVIENRFDPLEERFESYLWTLPEDIGANEVVITAVLCYRRMPDSLAETLGVERRPVIEVSRSERVVKVVSL